MNLYLHKTTLKSRSLQFIIGLEIFFFVEPCLLVQIVEPENGETGLHLAACKNNEKMISFLLSLGASPNMVDLKGRTPAMRAAEFGHTQALTLLTEADTDLTCKENL